MENSTQAKAKVGRPKEGKTQIVGFRLPVELAREVKVEASMRGLSLKDLFTEIWRDYQRKK